MCERELARQIRCSISIQTSYSHCKVPSLRNEILLMTCMPRWCRLARYCRSIQLLTGPARVVSGIGPAPAREGGSCTLTTTVAKLTGILAAADSWRRSIVRWKLRLRSPGSVSHPGLEFSGAGQALWKPASRGRPGMALPQYQPKLNGPRSWMLLSRLLPAKAENVVKSCRF